MAYDKHTQWQSILIKGKSARQICFRNTTQKQDVINSTVPIVLTVNSGQSVDWAYTKLTEIPKQLMYVRVNTNTWNLPLVHGAVHWYISKHIPVVLSFMKYKKYGDIPAFHQDDYFFEDSQWSIKTSNWLLIMTRFNKDPRVYTCGQNGLSDKCSDCGHCMREYYNVMERLSESQI